MPKKTRRTRRQKPRKAYSLKRRPMNKMRVVHTFLTMLHTIKLYHWKTHSYAEHKATDELYDKLNGHIDRFIEVWIGKDRARIPAIPNDTYVIHHANSNGQMREKIHKFNRFLMDMERQFPSSFNSDLLNIRDEILADMNQFLYLLTFR